MVINIGYHQYQQFSLEPLIWFRADKGVIVDGNNKVEKWENQGTGGNAYDVVQTTESNRPLWKDIEANGKPTLMFDGINDILDVTTPITINALFVVANWTGVSPFDRYCSFVGLKEVDDSGNYTTFMTHNTTTNFYPAQSIFLERYINSILTLEYSPLYSYKVSTGINNSSIFINNGFTIGRESYYWNAYWQGGISEILIFNKTLLNMERIQIESYLMKKYAI